MLHLVFIWPWRIPQHFHMSSPLMCLRVYKVHQIFLILVINFFFYISISQMDNVVGYSTPMEYTFVSLRPLRKLWWLSSNISGPLWLLRQQNKSSTQLSPPVAHLEALLFVSPYKLKREEGSKLNSNLNSYTPTQMIWGYLQKYIG